MPNLRGYRDRYPHAFRSTASRSLPNCKAGVTRSRDLNQVVSQLREGKNEEAIETWKRVVAANVQPRGRPLNVDLLVNWVIREAFFEQDAELKPIAQRLRYAKRAESLIDDEISYAKEQLNDRGVWPRDVRVVTLAAPFIPGGAVVSAAVSRSPIERSESRRMSRQGMEAWRNSMSTGRPRQA